MTVKALKKCFLLLAGLILASLIFCLLWNATTIYDLNFKKDFGLPVLKRMLAENSGIVIPVLILAYHRGGSTYFSEMFNLNPEAFFVFEPLRTVEKEYTARKTSPESTRIHCNGTIVPLLENWTKKTTLAQQMAEHQWFASVTTLLEKIFRCQLNDLPEKILRNKFMMRSKRHSEYGSCLLNSLNSTWKCLPLLTRICLSSKIRAIKVIRVHRHSNILNFLMKRFPFLKLIHLIRDPRGIVMSRKRLANKFDSIKLITQDLCSDMELDICKNVALFESYPHRVAKILYEDMAENPKKVGQYVYKFLQQQISEEMLNLLLSRSSSKTADGDYGTHRINSSITAYTWMWAITPRMTRFIDSHCGVVYRYCGYSRLKYDDQLWDYDDKLRIHGAGVDARRSCTYV